MIHWRLPDEKCKSVCARGKAMLITVASKSTINWARLKTDIVHHRRECALWRFLLMKRFAVNPLGN
jgi:hypothetical protein